jgi:hypothetical protein
MAKDARFQEAVWFLALSEDPESIKVSTSNIRSLVTRESIYNQLSSPSDLHLDHSHQLRRHILHTYPAHKSPHYNDHQSEHVHQDSRRRHCSCSNRSVLPNL